MSTQNSFLFQEIIQSPELLNVRRHVSGLLDHALWWAVDAHGQRQQPASQTTPEDAGTVEDQALLEQGVAATRAMLDNPNWNGKVLIQTDQDHCRAMIPFYHRARLIGVIGVRFQAKRPSRQTRSTIDLLDRYIYLYTSLLSEYDDLEYVHDIWRQMVSASSLDELLPRILNETLRALQITRGVLYLLDDDGKLVPCASTTQSRQGVEYYYLGINGRDYQTRFAQSASPTLELSDEDPLSRWTNRNLRPDQTNGIDGDWKNWSYLAIPFWRKDRLMGIVVAQAKGKKIQVALEERMLSIITDGAAAVLENSLNVNRIQKRSLALSTIHTIHRILSSSTTSADLLDKIARLTTQVLRVSKCSLMMIEGASSALNPVAEIGLQPGEIGTRPLKPEEGIPGWVLASCEPLIVHFPGVDERFREDPQGSYPEKSYLAVPMIDEDMLGVIMVSGRPDPFTPEDREILLTLSEQAVIALDNVRLIEKQQNLVLSSLRSIANVLEMRDPTTKGHTHRVEEIARQLGKSVQGDAGWLMNLRYASLLHDSGEIGLSQQSAVSLASTSRDVLQQAASPEQLYREHPMISVQIARSMQLGQEVFDMIRHHHEHFDGTGFPEGLKGEKIPLGARIIALTDDYVSLEEKSSKHKGYSKGQILAILHKRAGRKYDPRLVDQLQDIILSKQPAAVS